MYLMKETVRICKFTVNDEGQVLSIDNIYTKNELCDETTLTEFISGRLYCSDFLGLYNDKLSVNKQHTFASLVALTNFYFPADGYWVKEVGNSMTYTEMIIKSSGHYIKQYDLLRDRLPYSLANLLKLFPGVRDNVVNYIIVMDKGLVKNIKYLAESLDYPSIFLSISESNLLKDVKGKYNRRMFSDGKSVYMYDREGDNYDKRSSEVRTYSNIF